MRQVHGLDGNDLTQAIGLLLRERGLAKNGDMMNVELWCKRNGEIGAYVSTEPTPAKAERQK